MHKAFVHSPKPRTNQTEPIRILVVDDSLAERSVVMSMLTKLEYEVFEACNGVQALKVMDEQPIDLILSDWRMPELNGLDLCVAVKKRGENAPYFIMVTGQNNPCDLVAGMDSGADDFITKPFVMEEMRVRLEAGERIVQLRKSLDSRNKALKGLLERETHAKQAMLKDLKAAEMLQRAMLPEKNRRVGQIELAHFYQPAMGVAGDIYNVLHLDENHVAFYLIDVAGHGIRSAMLSFYASQLLSATGASHSLCFDEDGAISRPSAVAARLNQTFTGNADQRDYLTMIYGVLNTQTGQCALCQAGHPPPMHIPSGEQRPRYLGKGGFAVGMLEDATYEDMNLTLSPGDRLLLTSDGLYECRLKTQKEVTPNHMIGLMAHLRQFPTHDVQKQLDTMFHAMATRRPVEDDLSILMIHWSRPEQRAHCDSQD
ncbi:PP2C family protein-serine/threonine phosphatase [Marinobacter qingdaonensis]|uniref:SpoIIE family protein phosphatase n=1 Tax=Marinobacter qingdaonensis TaxID=3108486 RepID=A0ABU5NUU3_9GAMM|nr:SpoIIE family protein phosphatase [Marinobacter sp. ASW11-75]MEA1079580.1 SpoIIE family protein phosphatase [Marinobacter sp. ASW11-75]